VEEDFLGIAMPGGSQHHTALRLYGVNALRASRLSEAIRESTACGGRVSMPETCDAPSGAINTIPAAKPRSVVTGRATGH